MKHLIALSTALLAGMAVSSGAQTPAAAAAPSDGPAKIAVIAFQGAVTQTNEFLNATSPTCKRSLSRSARS